MLGQCEIVNWSHLNVTHEADVYQLFDRGRPLYIFESPIWIIDASYLFDFYTQS